MKTDRIMQDYERFKAVNTLVGQCAAQAWRSAQLLAKWRALESTGKVRIKAEPEQENYFDVYGLPEGYENARGHWVSAQKERDEVLEILERDGCWYVVSEYWDEQRQDWVRADSVGMCTGYSNPTDPFQNAYVIDLMSEAVEHYETQEVCPMI